MAINPDLLIAAPILQDYFSDNATDTAMSAGVITCYKDNSRTTLKNWYYQTGIPGAYTYTQLPNPLTLSAAGTITDAMGNDTIPFWYPFSEIDNETVERYYVTVDNSNGQRQFTRQNFPYNLNNGGGTSGSSALKNLIINNTFWRNNGTIPCTFTSATPNYSLNSNTLYYVPICPSQHDGFVDYMADMTFVKNAVGATDIVTFQKFGTTELPNSEPQPEYYMNLSCANSGTSETIKYVQVPICLHVNNLSDTQNCSVVIYSQNVNASPANIFSVSLFQFQGSGVVSPTVPPLQTITTVGTWNKTIIKFAFPVATLPATGAGDDGWFLQFNLPKGVAYNLNIAKPAVYLTSTPPSDDFDTYEYSSAFIDSPRCGDVRASMNNYFYNGWVPMNGGTIGYNVIAAPAHVGNALIDISTWPVFYKLWNLFSAYNSGTTNTLAQMYDTNGAPVAYGASAIADWQANKQMALTNTMGKVLLGTVPASNLNDFYNITLTFSNSAGTLVGTTANNVNFFQGMPVYFTNTGGAITTALALNTIYYISGFNGTSSISFSTTFANAIAGTVIAWNGDAGTGTTTILSALAGSSEGEYGHVQLGAELAAHTHNITVTGDGTSNSTVGSGGGGAKTDAVTQTTGSSSRFNVTQPGIFLNMYMKL